MIKNNKMYLIEQSELSVFAHTLSLVSWINFTIETDKWYKAKGKRGRKRDEAMNVKHKHIKKNRWNWISFNE